MFDFRDLAALLIKVFSQPLTDQQKKMLSNLKAVLNHLSAELASDLSQHDKFYSVEEDSSLLDAIDFFAKGMHRVVVLNQSKELVGVLSQSDALKYFFHKLEKSDDEYLQSLKKQNTW